MWNDQTNIAVALQRAMAALKSPTRQNGKFCDLSLESLKLTRSLVMENVYTPHCVRV